MDIGGPGTVEGVKSIQRGNATIANGTAQENVTISSVDISRAAAFMSWGVNTDDARLEPRAAITTSTNLNISRSGTGGETYVSWQVIEFN